VITSKDDSATASLLGFAIANRVDPSPALALESSGKNNGKDDGGKE
jgi:hypothetical protein